MAGYQDYFIDGKGVVVVWAIVIGLVVGLSSFALKFIKLQDPEYVAEEKLNFERAHASWVATGENYAESIEKLVAADCVVLVEKQEQSTFADITKELEALKAWNKTVLGAVVVGTDAVM